jgi:hypothetical protein
MDKISEKEESQIVVESERGPTEKGMLPRTWSLDILL